MTEFKRSRLNRKTDEQITKKTILLGVATAVLFFVVVFAGLPLLVKFSIFLGETKSRKEVIVEKVLPPLPPRVVMPFEATNSAKINISGLAEANVQIELLKNDASLNKIETNENGEFVFENVELNEGDNEFNLVAVSTKGGTSELSKTIKVVFDNKAPELTMTNPVEDSLKVDNPDFDVVGKSEKGVSVTVSGHVAMVDDTGQFKSKIQLNSGDNDVEIIVRDLAGNETKKKVKITYNI
jgi:bacillopeptidase F